MGDGPALIAYTVGDEATMGLSTAPVRRAWMDGTNQQFANRCLPILLGNQSGWWITTKRGVTVSWDGGPSLAATTISDKGSGATSQFGHGIVTWTIPWLFRTSPGWNLLVRGPANWLRDGITPLEGVVETDWLSATFTVNWMFTAVGSSVTWEPGEPIAQLVPMRRGDLESVLPVMGGPLPADDDADFKRWRTERNRFNRRLAAGEPAAVAQGWQRDYFIGRGVPEHQRKLKLRSFE